MHHLYIGRPCSPRCPQDPHPPTNPPTHPPTHPHPHRHLQQRREIGGMINPAATTIRIDGALERIRLYLPACCDHFKRTCHAADKPDGAKVDFVSHRVSQSWTQIISLVRRFPFTSRFCEHPGEGYSASQIKNHGVFDVGNCSNDVKHTVSDSPTQQSLVYSDSKPCFVWSCSLLTPPWPSMS
jgi:hypothetical protein